MLPRGVVGNVHLRWRFYRLKLTEKEGVPLLLNGNSHLRWCLACFDQQQRGCCLLNFIEKKNNILWGVAWQFTKQKNKTDRRDSLAVCFGLIKENQRRRIQGENML
ncbi:unnamed protein product [Lactuca virosa]|uniref:Uncharacterized protein n=1 Tax=Lactuca virosa TaxID=75947 RepID=A0AAU9NUJ5_9ASTR|nr:unnamed protein product [Lactuca virosa]